MVFDDLVGVVDIASIGRGVTSRVQTFLITNYQHEFLQAGFYAELWKSPGQATLGELTQAGLHQLYTGAGCCLDALQTYALLGDPMTRVRVTLPDRYFVPMLER